MNIMEELNNEGVNLQETKLNLINQGYEWYFDWWFRSLVFESVWRKQFQITKQFLKEQGLI